MHVGVRLLRAHGVHAAWPAELGAVCHHPHPVGQQRRRERIASEALIVDAIELKGERPRPVDAAAR